MKSNSRKEAAERIENFFQKKDLEAKQVKKIKKLAMTHRMRLGENRKRFCKKCYADLRVGRNRTVKGLKKIKCLSCNFLNKWKITLS